MTNQFALDVYYQRYLIRCISYINIQLKDKKEELFTSAFSVKSVNVVYFAIYSSVKAN